MRKTENVKSVPIYLTVYASFFDIHAQLPILALFAAAVGADPFWIGAIVGIYSVFNIIGNGLSGMAIDRWGWRKPLLFGLILVNLALYGYQLVDSTFSLLLIRGFNGFAGGILIPTTLSALAPESGKSFKAEHTRSVSFFGISVGLAALTGPPFAGIISNIYSFKAAYLGIALLMSAATIFTLFFTKEKERVVAPPFTLEKKSMYFRLPAVSLTACLLSFALMGGTGTLAAFMPIIARSRGFSQGGIGMLFGLFAMMVVLLQAWRASKNNLNVKPFHLAIGGISAIVMALFTIHVAVGQIMFAAAILLYGFGFGIVFPTILIMVMQGISAEKKGIITGIFFAFYSLGTAVVPPIAGYIWQRLPNFSPPLTAIIIIVLLTLMAGYFHRIAQKEAVAEMI
jgi:MFS transporter, DHA1 family, multidrug resistance protein